MGCDIHMWLEKKNLYTKEWEDSNIYDKKGKRLDPYTGRDYNLFTYLADVRNSEEIKPITKRKGYPSDISEFTKKDLDKWEDDIHSITYYTLAELIEASLKIQYDGLAYFTSCISAAASAFYYDYRPEDFRAIIGFDN